MNIDILDLDWQVDLSNARSVVGEKVILAGNINPVVVQDSTKEEVYELCHQLAEQHGNERFILAAGCEITVLTPPENLEAMRRASKLLPL